MSRWINQSNQFKVSPIPENSITKPPSAELRPDQLDEDLLPSYEELDAILRPHIDGDQGVDDIEESTSFIS